MNTSVTFGSCNTPQGHRDEIPLGVKARVDFLAKEFNDVGVGVAALQEYGPLFNAAWKNHPNMALVLGKNNNMRGQRPAMNAIVYRKDKYKVLDTRNLRFRIPGRPIYMVAALFEDKISGATFVFIAVHIPTRRDAGRTKIGSDLKRAAINARLYRYANRCFKMGHPVIIAGDRNDGKMGLWSRGFTRGVQHTIDWIMGKGVVFSKPVKIPSVWRKVTDHHAAVAVTARFKVNRQTPEHLP